MEERENNLAMMRLVIDLAADLDVQLVKVFAAWPGVVNDEDETAFYAVREGQLLQVAVSRRPAPLATGGGGLREAADYAAERASRWPSRITRPCCGPATRTRSPCCAKSIGRTWGSVSMPAVQGSTER